ncbi:MAG: Crossover junction endonuclease mus81 [Chaenotheca gracillima]|nr:MAG: Crossover junction endonuclease mus81 [Chaenotheca gracillima]
MDPNRIVGHGTVAERANSTTTVLVHNIHCASCVSYVKDVLSTVSPTPTAITANVLTHEVRVQHDRCVSLGEIAGHLMNAGFELHSAFTEDSNAQKVSEAFFDDDQSQAGWLENTVDRWASKVSSGGMCPMSPGRDAATADEKKTLHIQNCEACQVDYRALAEKERGQPVVEQKGKSTPKKKNRMSFRRPVSHEGLDRSLLGKSRPRSDQALHPLESLKEVHSPQTPPYGSPSLSTNGFRFDASANKAAPFVIDLGHSVSGSGTESVGEYEAVLSVGGMTCGSCAGSISTGLEELAILQSINVNLLSNSATIRYRGGKDDVKIITQKIEDLGFDCSVEECSLVLKDEAQVVEAPHHGQTKDQEYEAILSISGMTCASCTTAVTEGLSNLDFVKAVDVSLLTNSARVRLSGSSDTDALVVKVEDLGFDCSLEQVVAVNITSGKNPSEEKMRMIKVEGFFCEHCPPRVLEALRLRYGKALTIQRPCTLATPVLSIAYMPQAPEFTIRNILATINEIDPAFRAVIHHPPSIEERSREIQLKERRSLLRRLLFSFIVALPTFLIGIVWMTLVHPTNTIRVYMEESMWAGNVTRADWALFILATPVMFYSANTFHRKALKEIIALWRRSSNVPIMRRLYRFGSMNLLISAGTSVAYFSSLAILILEATSKQSDGMGRNHTTTYFDSVVFLTMFILIGRFLDAYSKSKAGDAVMMLGQLRPTEALLIEPRPLKDLSPPKDQPVDLESRETIMQRVNSDVLETGDVVRIVHGSSPPADGIIIDGETKFDESALTGESRLITKSSGDQVFSGTMNKGKVISIRVTGAAGSSMLDQIVKVVREGQGKRAPVERVADLLLGYFVPVITLAAICTFVIWFSLGQGGILPENYRDVDTGGWAFWALEFAIAVFVVACPCGIGLAAPTALFVGSGLAAQHGILVKGGGEAFQEASNLDTVVFDKTGTLTEGGNPKVTDFDVLPSSEWDSQTMWALAHTLEDSSSHPIARSIVSLCLTQTRDAVLASDTEEVPGQGLRGTFSLTPTGSSKPIKYEAAIGSEAYINKLVSNGSTSDFWKSSLTKWKSEGKSVALLAIRPTSSSSDSFSVAAQFAITDPIRPEASSVISTLQKQGLAVYMLTGDNPTTAHAVGNAIGIPITNIIAGVLPEEKADAIRWLQAWGPKRGETSSASFRPSFNSRESIREDARRPNLGTGQSSLSKSSPPNLDPNRQRAVAMLGDGINDAPALAAATVSIAIGSGSDIALSASKFVLLSSTPSSSDNSGTNTSTSSLTALLTLLSLSSAVFRRVKFNFAWALVYNVCMVPLAAGVLFPIVTGSGEGHWRLSPVWASAAMALSSVSVVLSSLALRTRWMGVGFRAPKV